MDQLLKPVDTRNSIKNNYSASRKQNIENMLKYNDGIDFTIPKSTQIKKNLYTYDSNFSKLLLDSLINEFPALKSQFINEYQIEHMIRKINKNNTNEWTNENISQFVKDLKKSYNFVNEKKINKKPNDIILNNSIPMNSNNEKPNDMILNHSIPMNSNNNDILLISSKNRNFNKWPSANKYSISFLKDDNIMYNLNVSHIKKIKSIELIEAILPININKFYPYIYIVINEFNSNYITNNNNLSKAYTILTAPEITKNNIYKFTKNNISYCYKEFNPYIDLGKITITVYNSNNELYEFPDTIKEHLLLFKIKCVNNFQNILI